MSEPSEKKELLHHDPDRAIPEAGILGAGIVKVGLVFAIGIVISALILFWEVIMRYVFNAPTVWAHETVVFLNASAFIFGGLYAASLNKHIRVVLFYDNLSPWLRRTFDVVISGVCMIASGFFAWAAWQSVKRAVWTPTGDLHFETSGSAWNPPFPGYLKVFLFFILIVLAIQFLVLAFNYARRKVAD
ncbi:MULTISPECIES: TRAP transporter small permease subunit [Pseudovibrio]|uniref:TRAP transporter small permease subunit n=1 Tax=Stappiaceae TaxID=2821832 RepID=UPI00236735E7|nr:MULTISPECIES: TRAP transporter small permease [Pseudovibrio]MDD7911467.1 TRAP transporter small permease [Pseudovibrio exalbescens]MDX5594232.1 TRAP transporter small permease [Pseudovibrio sp. SPO723]